MNKDLTNNISPKVSIPVLLRTANAAVNGTGVDLQGYESACVEFITGTLTDGANACKIQHCDDDSSYVDAPAADVLGTQSFSIALTDDNKVFKLGYIGDKRYIRAVMTQSAATSGGTFGANVIRGNARSKPSAVSA